VARREYNSKAWRDLRAVVLERDGWRCHLCGGMIDPNPRSHTEPLAGEADHLKPVAHGGSNQLTNLAAAHVRCNRRRGDSPAPKKYEQVRRL